MARDPLPTRLAIAEAWIAWEKDNKCLPPWDSSSWDWGEASCMACGYWAESWDVPSDPMQSWNRAKGLQRCHVVPAALGGASTPDNLVLMCADCHRDAPDTSDAAHLFEWMKARKLLRLPGIPLSLAAAQQVADGPEGSLQRLEAAAADVAAHFDPVTGARYSEGTEAYLVAKALQP